MEAKGTVNPDYRINLISPEAMSEDDLEKFQTEFRQVMKFIKYSRDKNELRSMLELDKSFESVDRDTADVIDVVTNLKLKNTGKETSIDMCKAVRDLIEEDREEDMEKGMEKGTILSMMKMIGKGILTVSQAAELSDMTVEEFQKKAAVYA